MNVVLNKGPRVLALTGNESGCTLWRVWQPYTELQRQGYAAWFRSKDDAEIDTIEWAYLAATRLDAIVIPRFSWEDHTIANRFVATVHRSGLAVIYDVDDDVFTPQIRERQQATTEKDKTLERLEGDRRDRIAAIRLCDGVTTTNGWLAGVIEQYVKPGTPVCVVPNAMDTRWFSRQVHGAPRETHALTIGWAGGARVAADLEPLAEAWHTIAERYPDVRFVIQGFLSEELARALPAERLSTIPWLPLGEYPRGMRQMDVGCCSVSANHFNRCKTPIKLWEFTLAGAACVVSSTLYGQVASDQEDALVADTPDEWVTALSRLIESPELRRKLQRAQRRRIAEYHSLQRTARYWPLAWSQILEHFRAQQAAAA